MVTGDNERGEENMSESACATEHTTLSVRRETKSRLESLRPYDSLSWTEFVEKLADIYEERER